MKFNIHAHTWRCNHAEPDERAYIERAIEGGIKVMGFSDHTPYPFNNGYKSHIRMDVSQVDDYVGTLTALKKEYEKDIELHIGFEAEYYPAHFTDLLKLAEQYPIEYLILGQHFKENESSNCHYNGSVTYEENILSRYCDQVIDALDLGCFTYLAHPDLINYRGSVEIYKKHIRRLCVQAKSLSIPLEINLLGLGERRHYPNKAFWEVAAETGNDVILGYDSHRAIDAFRPDEEKTAMEELVKPLGLKLIDHCPLVKPV